MLPPSALLSDGLVYRFRLRPLTARAATDPTPFAVGEQEFTFDCVFSDPSAGNGAHGQEGTLTTPAGDVVSFRVNDEEGGSGHGVRVFAGPRWDPFIMDAPAALKTIATGELAFTDSGAIYMDGKNVLSLVVEVDCAQLLAGVELVGVVAETLTRGRFNVRIERVGRPEVKNMMLAPKQFDPVNRDLEIRDLYNMEDAFQLADGYQGAYRARLDANLAFWDGLDGKTDWPPDENGAHPLTEFVLADYLVVDVGKPYAEQGSFLEIERAADGGPSARDLRWAFAQRRRDGQDLHAARERRQRADHPRRRRPRDAARRAHLPLPRAGEPGSSTSPLSTTTRWPLPRRT